MLAKLRSFWYRRQCAGNEKIRKKSSPKYRRLLQPQELQFRWITTMSLANVFTEVHAPAPCHQLPGNEAPSFRSCTLKLRFHKCVRPMTEPVAQGANVLIRTCSLIIWMRHSYLLFIWHLQLRVATSTCSVRADGRDVCLGRFALLWSLSPANGFPSVT